jgi:hypothetical protein
MDESLHTGLTLMGLIGAILLLGWLWNREDKRDAGGRR